MDGKVISLEEINQLAKTPSRDVLIAKIMGSLNSPISALTRTLQAIVDNGVELSEIEAPKKEEVAEETAPAENEAPAASEAAPAAE